jgi:thiol-disulfide isomerase/thioredoxin
VQLGSILLVEHYKGDANAVTDNGDNRKSGSPIHIAVKPMENVELRRAGKTTPEEIRLARVLGIVVIVFFACWFPYCISMILSIVAPDAGHRIFYMATLLIGYFNSCCNPIIYGILNKRFTNGIRFQTNKLLLIIFIADLKFYTFAYIPIVDRNKTTF